MLDESGEPSVADDDSGIAFPSNDGFKIHMDFTAVWGIMPDQAANVIAKFGNLEAVETKVVVPQIESIGRNKGSSVGAVDLLVGETRQKFQDEVSACVSQDSGRQRKLTLLHGFVRNIHIPQEVRKPIQEKFIADELKLTREQELLTARTEATLREAEKKVDLEKERVSAETMKMVAQAIAEGNKEAEETKAETLKKVAAIDRKTAELDAEASVKLGKAKASAKQLEAEAKSELFGAIHVGGWSLRQRQCLQPMGLCLGLAGRCRTQTCSTRAKELCGRKAIHKFVLNREWTRIEKTRDSPGSRSPLDDRSLDGTKHLPAATPFAGNSRFNSNSQSRSCRMMNRLNQRRGYGNDPK